MMDPITIFAVAGNALQFVQLGVDIVSKTIEYSHGGGHSEFQALRDCLQRLSVSNAHLQKSMELNAAHRLPPGPARALHAANVECMRVSNDIATALDKLGFNKPHSVWSSVKLALKSQITEKKLQSFSKNLSHARANLMLSLMVFLNDQSAVNREDMNQQNRMIAEQALKITEESAHIKEDVARLSASLSALKFEHSTASADLGEAMTPHESQLNTISTEVEWLLDKHKNHLLYMIKKLSEHLEQLDGGVKALSSEVRQLLPAMTREILARRQVLESIWFSKIDHRRQRISRAHSRTYQWIFKHKEDEVVLWDDFVDWLHKGEQAVYWVSGKPGSGKSTLMRELDERTGELGPSQGSADAQDFLKASFYFWYAGNNEEKSTSGLLRSLVYQLLLPHPEIIDEVISPWRWEAALTVRSRLREWAETELQEVLSKIVQRLEGTRSILLFIDGLDEQDGSDEEREEVLDLLQTLTKNKNVKACVASRPWNIFRAAFRECPQLRLEELTKDDISYYVRDKLGGNLDFKRLQQQEPDLLRTLTQEVVGKARGVFLWVRLVVRDFLRVLRDGGGSKRLFKELSSIPLELDDYFLRMFESIEKPYRRDASVILQTALCVMDQNTKGEAPRDSGLDFLLIHLHFLEESDDLSFAAKNHLYPVDHDHLHEAQQFLEPLERVLASRCMGLLEVDTDSMASQESGFQNTRGMTLRPWRTRIEFLHRTVRDYFATPAAMCLLHQYTDGPFDAHMFRCNLLVTNMTTKAVSNPPLTMKWESATNFLHQIQSRPDGEEASFSLFDKMVELIEEQALGLGPKARHASISSDHAESLAHWTEHHNNAISLAIQLGWTTYVRTNLTTAMVQGKKGRPLLDYALRPSISKPRQPNHQIASILLSRGACPDTSMDGMFPKSGSWKPDGAGQDATETRLPLQSSLDAHIVQRPSNPIWIYFLISLVSYTELNLETYLETIQALLMHGVHTKATIVDLERALDRTGRSLPGVQDGGRPVLLFPRGLRWAEVNVGEKLYRRLREIKSPESQCAARHVGTACYSFLEVLQSLRLLSEEGQEVPMFPEGDIAAPENRIGSPEHWHQCQHLLPAETSHFPPNASVLGVKRGIEAPSSSGNDLLPEPARFPFSNADGQSYKKGRYV
ncbi:hypothetical protein PV04_04937 [Phialophora macrospora]|uniref:Uncharacterized protein n=1 Tax=Phialophora macrospora TaxID=1851006 RepID=A0A0D2FLR3_9EURO|nr:hypothetical protein PV04_04937 [Phialophora macrospora]